MLSFLICSRLLSLVQGFCSGAVIGDVTECRLGGPAAARWANHRFSVLSPFDGCRMCGSTHIMHVAGSRLNCNELFSVRRPLRERVRQCVWQIRWQAYCLGRLPLTKMFVAELCDCRLFKGLQVSKQEWKGNVAEERMGMDLCNDSNFKRWKKRVAITWFLVIVWAATMRASVNKKAKADVPRAFILRPLELLSYRKEAWIYFWPAFLFFYLVVGPNYDSSKFIRLKSKSHWLSQSWQMIN